MSRIWSEGENDGSTPPFGEFSKQWQEKNIGYQEAKGRMWLVNGTGQASLINSSRKFHKVLISCPTYSLVLGKEVSKRLIYKKPCLSRLKQSLLF